MDAIEITKALIQIAKPSDKIEWDLPWLEELFLKCWFEIKKIYTLDPQRQVEIPHYLLTLWNWEKHIWFVAHYDVVSYWEWWHNPANEAIIKDWKLFWRWVTDMLSWLAVALYTFPEFKEDYRFSLFVTWNEETENPFPHELFNLLDSKLDYVIWGEPTSEKTSWDIIKIWRRWRASWIIKIYWDAMHAAYVDIRWWDNLTRILLKWELNSLQTKYDDWEGIMPPTSFAINEIRSEYIGTNTIPWEIEIWFDARISSVWTPETFEQELHKRLKDIWLRYDLKINSTFEPYLTNDKKYIESIEKSITKATWKSPKINCEWGTSDCRFFWKIWIPTVEIWVENSTMHKPNESQDLSNIEILCDIYRQILKDLR